MAYKKPSYKELEKFAHKMRKYQPEALETIELHGFVFDDIKNDEWQGLAFTFYTQLVEIKCAYDQLFDDGMGV